MSENAVIFKGTKEGLYIILKDEVDFEAIKQNLDQKIKPSKKFFEGASIVNFKGKSLSVEEYNELKSIMLQEYGMNVIGTYEDSIEKASTEREESPRENTSYERLPFENVITGDTLIVRATVRSGQFINYNGNIVVIGDVNPGAVLKASGSIVVMGTMRGVAHAGANGSYDTFIASFNIQPTQLRIGDIITRSPDGVVNRPQVPEMAVVKQGMIVVEPYLPNK